MGSFFELFSVLSIIDQDDNLRHFPLLLYHISDKGMYTNDTD